MEGFRRSTAIQEVEPVSEVELPPPTGRAETSALLPFGYLLSLWQARRFFQKVAVWALAAGLLVAFLIPKKYESAVSVMPPDSLGNGAMLAALAEKASPGLAAMAGNVFGMKNTGALFVSLLSSRTVQGHIVERFNLQKVYGSRYKEDARKVLASRTSIDEERKSGVITVIVTEDSPQRAHDLADAYVEELNRLVSQVSTSSARRERIFIEGRLASVKSDLEDAEKEFSVFASKNTTLDIKEQTKAMVESAAELQAQVIAAQSELQGLEQVYAENNVRVRSLKARILELQRQLQKIGGMDASLTSSPFKPDEELYPSIRQLPLLGVQWADLYRRMKVQEKVYELLTQQYELARMQEAKEIPIINVIDPANVPEKKSYPPRLLVALTITGFCLLASAVYVLGLTRWQKIDARDPRKLLAMRTWEGVRIWSRGVAARFRLRGA